ncbi:MAG TPA: hypothetical protein VHX87_02555 [Galbitalea sp.]|jgi:hypothetical protein|nr:hypothetical protein [Galbitalea sp.]
MTKARIPLVVAGLVAAFLLVQFVVVAVVQFALLVLGPGALESKDVPEAVGSYAGGVLAVLVQLVFFGAGVYLSLRYIAPLRIDDGWKRTVVRGVIATLLGVAAVVVLGLVEALINASSVSPYPFAYSFGYSLAPEDFASRLPQAFEMGLNPLISWLVPVVLATVLLRVWLARQVVAAVTTPAAVAAKL